MSIFRFFDGKPMNASFWVPVILARTTTLSPSWRMSSIVSFKSGKVVVSPTRRGFTHSGPAGVPGGDGISTQVSCRILSSSAGSLLVNASYQRVASFLYLFIFVFLSVSIVAVRVHEHRIRPSKVNKYFSIVLLS